MSFIQRDRKTAGQRVPVALRENIEYDQLSESFVDSLIATEDSRFF